tara:strand:- start:1333 stop:1848 length:516 start_codon:yes stop_codon:yes gene_type:complete
MSDKKIPITRVNKFFGAEDFNLQERMGMEWLHGWLNFTLVLYRVDREKTNTDDVYGEASPEEIRYFPPVEFKAYVQIAEPTNSSYASGLARYNEPGNLIVNVYKKHLEELDIDVRYGDYVGYPESEDKVNYYTVANDGKVTSDNAHTILGYKAFYRTIVCVPTQPNEFKGI